MLRVNEVPWRETWYTCESPSSATYKARDSARHYWYNQLKSVILRFARLLRNTASGRGITSGFYAYPVARIRQAAPLVAFPDGCRVHRYSIPSQVIFVQFTARVERLQTTCHTQPFSLLP